MRYTGQLFLSLISMKVVHHKKKTKKSAELKKEKIASYYFSCIFYLFSWLNINDLPQHLRMK